MTKIRFNTWELHNICNKYDWFTGGSCEAYDKLFERCKDGADFDELALLIWMCTPDSNRKEIYYRLLIERAERNLKEFSTVVESYDFNAQTHDVEENELLVETRKGLEGIVNA